MFIKYGFIRGIMAFDLKKTKLYTFVKSDYDAVQKRVKYALKNPHKSLHWYVLACLFFFVPGSFWATFFFLSGRYCFKYVKGKVKR